MRRFPVGITAGEAELSRRARGKTAPVLACSLRHKIRHGIFLPAKITLLEGGTHALLLHSSAAAVHERGQQPRSGSSPRQDEDALSRRPCSSCVNASGGYLLTTENFTVPSEVLYKSCIVGGCCAGLSAPFRFLAAAGKRTHDLPVPAMALWPLGIDPHVCVLPPTCRAQECLPAQRLCPCVFLWRPLAGSKMSPAVLCVPLTPKRASIICMHARRSTSAWLVHPPLARAGSHL